MVKKKGDLPAKSVPPETVQPDLPDDLFSDLVGIIESRKKAMYRQVNSGAVMMLWEIGNRINKEILGNERAEYGKQISATVSHQLQTRYGKSFERSNLTRMMKFAREFTDLKIVATLSHQLSWGHIKDLLPLENMDARLYYAEEAAKHNLGVRDLRHMISRKAYERREISNLKLSNQSKVPFNTFKDPVLLDLLGLKENFLEADLEKAIVTELEKFILEFGRGFSFVAR